MFSSDGRSTARSGGHYHFGHGGRGFEAEFDPFDLFAQMFGGDIFHGMQRGRQGRRHHYHHQQPRQQHQRQRRAQTPQNQMQALAPMVLVVVAWLGMMLFMGGFPGSEPEKYYSFRRSYKYNNKRYVF